MTDLGDLRDTFDGTSELWTYGPGATVSGGQLHCASGLLDGWPAGMLSSGDAYTTPGSLIDSYVMAELVEPADSASTRSYLVVYTGADPALNALQWVHYWDSLTGLEMLRASVLTAGAEDVLAFIPYSGTDHRWVQIRHSAGVAYWDTSPDGFSWSTAASSSTSLSLESARILLGAGTNSPGDTGQVTSWDNLNSPLILDDPVTLGPEGSPYLAVDVQPDNTVGTFQLDVSSLDGFDALAWTDLDPGAWVNVVCDVLRISYRRGAAQLQGALTHTEAGTVTVQLTDPAGVFDPMQNRDAIHKGTPLRIRAWGTDTAGTRWDAVLFTGEVDRVLGAYQREDVPRVTLTGVDLVGPLAAWGSEGREEPGVGAGDDLRKRALRILAESRVGGTVPTVPVDSTVILQPGPTPPATTAAATIRDRFDSGLTVYEDWSWAGMPEIVGDYNDILRGQYQQTPIVVAAGLILDRLAGGLPIFEDWSWYGTPQVVRDHNDALLISWGNNGSAITWLTNYIRTHARNWLAAYVTATTPPDVPTTVTTTTLEWTGAPQLSPDSDLEFVATLTSSRLAKPWQDLQLATEAELGRLWVDRHNRLVLRSRGSQLTGPIRGTLSDVHGEADAGVHCCMTDATVAYGPEQMANLALGKRRHAVTPGVPDPDPDVLVRRGDEYSQARYGTAVVERYSLELQTDQQVERWGEALVMAHIAPELRVDSVVPAPSPHDLDSALEAWPAVLQTDLGDRWLFRYHPQGRPVVSRAVGVVGIELEADPDTGWTVTWLTADAPQPGVDNPSGWFLVDVSELDGGEVLAPYSVPL